MIDCDAHLIYLSTAAKAYTEIIKHAHTILRLPPGEPWSPLENTTVNWHLAV